MADPAGLRLPGSGVFEIENLPIAWDFLRERGLNYVRNRRRGKKWTQKCSQKCSPKCAQTPHYAVWRNRMENNTWTYKSFNYRNLSSEIPNHKGSVQKNGGGGWMWKMRAFSSEQTIEVLYHKSLFSICCKLKSDCKEHLIVVFFDQKWTQKWSQKWPKSKPKTIDRQYTSCPGFYKTALLTFLLTQRIVRPEPNDYRKTIRFGLSAKRKITFSRLFKPPRITFFKVFQAAVYHVFKFFMDIGRKNIQLYFLHQWSFPWQFTLFIQHF